MINKEMHVVEDLHKVAVKSMREGYGEALVEIGETNERVVVLTADLAESMKVEKFKEVFPQRFVEVGIAEQNMMGVAAGMALAGKIPVINSFACFNPGRNWEQLRASVCLSKANVKIVGGHAGVGNGEDGGNQQAYEDIAITRVLPNLKVVVPADYEQVKKATRVIIEEVGPVYMRMTKPARPIITSPMTPFELGRAQVMREGRDVVVFACGALVGEALIAAEELAPEVDVMVVNVHTIKPLDEELVIQAAKKTGLVVTAEEHQIVGGLGGAIAEVLSEKWPVPMKRVGMRNQFGESGKPEELMRKYKMNKTAVVEAIKDLIK